jgi:hypothetical protein
MDLQLATVAVTTHVGGKGGEEGQAPALTISHENCRCFSHVFLGVHETKVHFSCCLGSL